MTSLQCAATLLLARHAEAEYDDELVADRGGSLTVAGRAAARELAAALRDRNVAAVYCSGMARAVQTAEIVAAALGVHVFVRDGLREFSVGDHAGAPYTSEMFDGVLARWADGDADARWPGGESAAEIRARAGAELDTVADTHRGETVLVVTHSGTLRAVLPPLLGLPASWARLVDLDHCALLEVAADADGWRLVAGPC